MSREQVEIFGNRIVDKRTHYEAYPSIGSETAKVIIRGDVVAAFQKRYRLPITEAGKMEVRVDLGRNDQRIRECQDPFRPALRLVGSICSLEDITYTP
jgi:hypothetical protein